jgi:hypothetical protein
MVMSETIIESGRYLKEFVGLCKTYEVAVKKIEKECSECNWNMPGWFYQDPSTVSYTNWFTFGNSKVRTRFLIQVVTIEE